MHQTAMEVDASGRPPLCSVLDAYVTGDEICQAFGFTRFTLARYYKDPLIGFPPPCKLGGKTYFSRRAISRWLEERTGDFIDL